MKKENYLTREQLSEVVGIMRDAPFYNRLGRVLEGEHRGKLLGYDEKKKQWILLEGLVRLSS